ncbi:MAG: hypothetical protein R2879_15180 [Saprospiraceae bacterium]
MKDKGSPQKLGSVSEGKVSKKTVPGNQFEESDLHFSFSKGWQVIAFDKHRFYQYVNGRGMRGVDFIGVHPEQGVFLMEVKNYRLRFGETLPYHVLQYLERPDLLAPVLIDKYKDSMRLLDAVKVYLNRRWWYRLACRSRFFSNYFISKETRFWLDFYSKYDAKDIWLLACLDAGEQDEKEFFKKWDSTGLIHKLENEFPENKVLVFNSYHQKEAEKLGIMIFDV